MNQPVRPRRPYQPPVLNRPDPAHASPQGKQQTHIYEVTTGSPTLGVS